jgi:hypothetical protein
MKKSIALAVLACFAALTAVSQDRNLANEKPFTFGGRVGLNYSTVSTIGGDRIEARGGIQLGILSRIRIRRNFYFRPELAYSLQGVSAPGYGYLNMNYLTMPLLLEYGRKFNIQAGLQGGYLLSATSDGWIETSSLSTYEMSGVAGVAYWVNEHFSIGFRYTVGFTNLFKDSSEDTTSRVIYTYVAYTF